MKRPLKSPAGNHVVPRFVKQARAANDIGKVIKRHATKENAKRAVPILGGLVGGVAGFSTGGIAGGIAGAKAGYHKGGQIANYL